MAPQSRGGQRREADLRGHPEGDGDDGGAADSGGGPIQRLVVDHFTRPIGRGCGDDPVANFRSAFDQNFSRHGRHEFALIALERANEASIQLFIDFGVAEAAGADQDNAFIAGKPA